MGYRGEQKNMTGDIRQSTLRVEDTAFKKIMKVSADVLFQNLNL